MTYAIEDTMQRRINGQFDNSTDDEYLVEVLHNEIGHGCYWDRVARNLTLRNAELIHKREELAGRQARVKHASDPQ